MAEIAKWILGFPYAVRSVWRAALSKWETEQIYGYRWRSYTTIEGAQLTWADGWEMTEVITLWCFDKAYRLGHSPFEYKPIIEHEDMFAASMN